MGIEREVPHQQGRLVVIARAAGLVSDFLKANEVWLQILDDPDDALQAIQTVAAADAFVDVVAKQAHGTLSHLGCEAARQSLFILRCSLRSGCRSPACGVDSSP